MVTTDKQVVGEKDSWTIAFTVMGKNKVVLYLSFDRAELNKYISLYWVQVFYPDYSEIVETYDVQRLERAIQDGNEGGIYFILKGVLDKL